MKQISSAGFRLRVAVYGSVCRLLHVKLYSHPCTLTQIKTMLVIE